MPQTLTPRLIGIAIPTLRELRAGMLSSASASDSGADAVRSLREAGYAGGDAIFDAFEQWLGEVSPDSVTGSGEPDTQSGGVADNVAGSRAGDLALEEFGERASLFFSDAGWGEMTFTGREDEGVAEVAIVDCWESDGEAGGAMPGCHLTTGMLAAFFGRIAGYPVAVLETECRGGGESRCCFAMGNADVMNYEWERHR